MKLTLLFDHRFYLNADGALRSLKNYAYPLFAKRYLGVFDEVQVLARVSGAAFIKQFDTYELGPGVKVVSVGNWQGPAEFMRQRTAVANQLRHYLAADTAVIMIAPGAIGSLAYGYLRKQRRPYAVEVVTDPYDSFASGANNHPLRPFLRLWATGSLRRECADAAAAMYVTREALQRRYPNRRHAVGVSDVEINAAALVDNPRLPSVRTGPINLLMVGTLAQLYKAPDVLIKAVGLCIADGIDLRLVIVGDGKHRPELETLVRTKGLAEHVHFRGQLAAGTAVRAEMDHADLFVLASYQEGLPRAMVEAMARSLPCIGSTVGGIPELLPAEDLVPPGDVQALARKIREVVTNPQRMAAMSARNLTQAHEYHENVLDQHRTAFYHLVRQQMETWLRAKRR